VTITAEISWNGGACSPGEAVKHGSEFSLLKDDPLTAVERSQSSGIYFMLLHTQLKNDHRLVLLH
jgi:hypothetical protein